MINITFVIFSELATLPQSGKEFIIIIVLICLFCVIVMTIVLFYIKRRGKANFVETLNE